MTIVGYLLVVSAWLVNAVMRKLSKASFRCFRPFKSVMLELLILCSRHIGDGYFQKNQIGGGIKTLFCPYPADITYRIISLLPNRVVSMSVFPQYHAFQRAYQRIKMHAIVI